MVDSQLDFSFSLSATPLRKISKKSKKNQELIEKWVCSVELRDLSHHLRLYIVDVRADDRFSNIEELGELSKIMVETRKHICYPLVYRLLNLVLVLPVATAMVERSFSAMKLVKTYLHNRLNDDSLSDNVICYVEKEEMKKVTDDQVVDRFMKIRKRKY